MSKRVYKDVFYQTLNAHNTIVHGGGTGTGIASVELPIPRGSYLPAGKQMVIEIIHVTFNVWGNMTQDEDLMWSLWTKDPSSVSTAAHRLWNPSCLLYMDKPASDDFPKTVHIVTEDQRGNGMIVATDKLYFMSQYVNRETYNSVVPTHTMEHGCRIRYRWRIVDTAEYVGIVQSQVD